jgi:hypothetical protein
MKLPTTVPTEVNMHSTNNNNNKTTTAHAAEIRGKSVTTVYKVQKFRPNNLNAPDDGRIGRTMLCEI